MGVILDRWLGKCLVGGLLNELPSNTGESSSSV